MSQQQIIFIVHHANLCTTGIRAIFSGKAGAVWIYTAPTLILILKYENIKLKKRIPSGRGPTSKP
jgi:hypothetical protein